MGNEALKEPPMMEQEQNHPDLKDVKGVEESNILTLPVPVNQYTKLFVYGTLKSGQHNNKTLGGSHYIGCGWLQGYRMKHLGGFPAIFKSDFSHDRVFGEIYEIAPEIRRSCDILEGVPNLYIRVAENMLGFGEVETYVMPMPHDEYKAILSGRWEGSATPWMLVTPKNPIMIGEKSHTVPPYQGPSGYPQTYNPPYTKPKEPEGVDIRDYMGWKASKAPLEGKTSKL